VTSVAGGEYGLNQVDPDDPDATLPEYTARQAWSQMGDRARQVPLLVIQGEDDAVVPPLVATRLVEHWAAVGDFVDDGLLNDSLTLIEDTTSVPSEQGRHSYAHTTITLPDGTSLVPVEPFRRKEVTTMPTISLDGFDQDPTAGFTTVGVAARRNR
jgi:hypothetical protein